MAHLSHSINGNIALITLNNPPQNRLSLQILDELDVALTAIGDSETRALLLRADGADFSFGGDIVPWPDTSTRELRTLFERYMNTFNRFERLSIPTVAAVQGLCFGGGLELAVRADVIIAAETARFGHPEQSLAIVTLLGGVYRVAERAGRSKAIEWALTAEQVPARMMEQHGVVNRVVPDDKLLDEAMAVVLKLATGPTRSQGAPVHLGNGRGDRRRRSDVRHRSLPLDSEDVKLALPASVEAFKAKQPRPVFPFKGK
jgi:enoyl-CoA hydratase/carnithine racemase